jgi:hypothetical protein
LYKFQTDTKEEEKKEKKGEEEKEKKEEVKKADKVGLCINFPPCVLFYRVLHIIIIAIHVLAVVCTSPACCNDLLPFYFH